MTAAACDNGAQVSPLLTSAVRAAVESTFSAIWGEAPVALAPGQEAKPSACVAGIISFAGDVPWSLSWAMTPESAPALAKKFTGADFPFDGPDIGEVVTELVNILAGDVVLQLDQRRIKAQMGLPMVARGCPLELMASRNSKVARLDYNSSLGRFWLGIVCSGH